MTLPLHERIIWLRKREGSHDKLAARLGTTRQTVIGWEKGTQPNRGYREKLAELSGFPAEAYRRTYEDETVVPRRELEDVHRELEEVHRRLEELAARLDRLEATLLDRLAALRDVRDRQGDS